MDRLPDCRNDIDGHNDKSCNEINTKEHEINTGCKEFCKGRIDSRNGFCQYKMEQEPSQSKGNKQCQPYFRCAEGKYPDSAGTADGKYGKGFFSGCHDIGIKSCDIQYHHRNDDKRKHIHHMIELFLHERRRLRFFYIGR